VIPLFATRSAIEPLLDEVSERQRRVVESGHYILGPELEAFESEFADYIGRSHCVGVASGTDALMIALRCLGVGPGDEVVVPAMSFFATAEAVVNAGARPVFADVDPDSHCLTAASAEPAIGSRTRAILPVHLFGNPAPMGELRELASSRGLRLIEDAAQAAGARIDGARAGGLGDAAAFSFYPGKNLGAFGDAGAIVCDSDEVASRARRLRNHATTEEPWVHAESGFNSRLDEIQAAGLRVLLPRLDEWTARRRATASTYASAAIAELVEAPTETPGAEAAYHLYVVATPDREHLRLDLERAGIESRAYYTTALHKQPAMAQLAGDQPLPNAERIAAMGLALPMGPALSATDVQTVVSAVRDSIKAPR
jgi:dTDP-3-amino-3,4,6-trideoxy-alpha-D-glucose transaminase